MNILLKNRLQIACGSKNSSNLTKYKIFPHLNTISSIKELREIVSSLSQNKAIAEISVKSQYSGNKYLIKTMIKEPKYLHICGTQKSLIQKISKDISQEN